jgi:deoxycytidylate deaminase
MSGTPSTVATASKPAADAVPLLSLDRFTESELVLGLIGATGTELAKVRGILSDRLRVIGYEVHEIRITQEVIPLVANIAPFDENDHAARINALMDAGNQARETSGNNGILATGAATAIASLRRREPTPWNNPRTAYIISSLKHPDEVATLREIYPAGFYLIGVHADRERRLEALTGDKRIAPDKALQLIERDEDEHKKHGQRVTDSFHMSDFFVRIDGNEDNLKYSLYRVLDLLFGNPHLTPTFDEYAMFMAFAASLRTADLSRQVGAVVTRDQQILATGANDCPRARGGLYWPEHNPETHRIEDYPEGRDAARGYDSNKRERLRIIEDIVSRGKSLGLDEATLRKAVEPSRVRDVTEYGRVVHAEMEALVSCGRVGAGTVGADMFVTTFPCHNCAKHIIAAGIRRVVFIEPYAKSKALEFHSEAMEVGFQGPESARPKVLFEPFVGVGPRRFFDLFSMNLGSGYALERKDESGTKIDWQPENARLRLQMLPGSYLDLEVAAGKIFEKAVEAKKDTTDGS